MSKLSIAVMFLVLKLQLYGQTHAVQDSSASIITAKETHTGVRNRPGLKPFLISSGMLIYGLISLDNQALLNSDRHVQHEMMEEFPNFSTIIDNHLRYVPVAAVYGLNLAGIRSRNSLVDRTGIYILATLIANNSADFLKKTTDRLRPDGSDRRSFPSGHTTSAFVAAEFMRQEYKDLSPLYGYAAYSAAATTGALRMMNNKHWLSDVIAGAGLGIISTKISYLAYPWLKKQVAGKKDMKIMALPIPNSHGIGLVLSASL